jgi:hypothetical protein
MPGQLLRKGVAEELAAGPLHASGNQLSPFNDGVEERYRRFHAIRITALIQGSTVGASGIASPGRRPVA